MATRGAAGLTLAAVAATAAAADQVIRTEFDNGILIEIYPEKFDVCESTLLLPAGNLWPTWLRFTLYLFALLYLFLGIAIIADIFMSAIEVITSKEKEVSKRDPETGGEVTIKARVWNETVANLTLMALGSSAPEILLALIETGTTLGKPPGELGPSTIVGSAAFNLLLITAVCVMAIPNGETRRIKEFGVFMITSAFSIWAYLWLVIVLAVWTPDRVTIEEAFLTFLMFPMLVGAAYGQDIGWGGVARKARSQLLGLSVSDGGQERVADKGALTKLLKGMTLRRKNKGGSSKQNQQELVDEAARQVLDQVTAHPSRMLYRVNAVRGLTGGRRVVRDTAIHHQTVASSSADRPGLARSDTQFELQPLDARLGEGESANQHGKLQFSSVEYAVMENAGVLAVTVRRIGGTSGRVTVDYATLEAPSDVPAVSRATPGEDYVTTSGCLTFEDGEDEKSFDVKILDDDQYEEDEIFFLVLSHATGGATLGEAQAKVTIIDDDEPGLFSFEMEKVRVVESAPLAAVKVMRTGGSDGIVKVRYETKDDTAKAGADYTACKGELEFAHGEVAQVIEVPILDDVKWERNEYFEVHLSQPEGGAQLNEKAPTICRVNIVNDENMADLIDNIYDIVFKRQDALKLTTSTWGEQFVSAMSVAGAIDELGEEIPPSTQDFVMHFLSFFWKVLFAFVPPTEYKGGWPTFWVSLMFIGTITYVVGELAGLMGCSIGLDDKVTAITIVALGTSLPDTFASRQAARQDPDADASVGNVTGSNSVNVFLGLGLPWLLASIYYESRGEIYEVKAGALVFSVSLFTGMAIVCIALLSLRRKMIGGELGGPVAWKYGTAGFLAFLWFMYILLSSLKAYGDL